MVAVGIALAGSMATLAWIGTAYGVYNYARLTRQPIRAPTDVSAGDAVGFEGTIAESSPRITTPCSRERVPVVFWRISRFHPGSDSGSGWALRASDTHHADTLTLTVDGHDVPVELPERLRDDHLLDAAFEAVVTVDPGEDPPPHVSEFEDLIGLHTEANRSRQYSEARYEPGDEVTVYGEVRPASGDVVTGSSVSLVPPNDDG